MLLALPFTGAVAQRVLSGTVTELATGSPMPGVCLAVKESVSIGTVTDEQGRYKLVFPDDKTYTVEVSYVGYNTVKYRATANVKKHEFVMTEDVKMLETVVVTATRTPKTLKDVPLVTRVIDAAEFRTADVNDVQDLLQTELPGIEFSYSMNQQTSLNMQGFGGNSVLFLVDGEKLAGETLDNIDYSRLTLNDVQRVEIVKGAASSLYGSNAVGGVVNLISREASEPWTLNLSGRWGMHNDWRTGANLSFNHKGFTSVTNLQYTSCDPIELKNDGDFGTIYGNRTINAKQRFSFTGSRFKITARAGYFFRERDSQETVHDRYRDFSGGLKGSYDIDEDNSIQMSYTFDQYDKSNFTLQNRLDVRTYSNVQHTLRTVYNHNFGKKAVLIAGGDYMRDYLMSYQFAENEPHIQHTADAFAQIDYNPVKKLGIVAGLRYDYYSEARLHHLSPKLAVMYRPGEFTLRTSYANGFRAPTLKEMYMNFDMANVFMIYGNKNLKPENSHNFNLAAEYSHNSYNVTVMGFYNLVDNRITTVWNKELNGMMYDNMSRMSIAGVDCSASASWDFGLKARLSYVYTYEKVHGSDINTSSTRPHSATLRIEYGKQWKHYGLTAALTGRYLSKVTCDEYVSLTDLTQTEKVTYPGYTLWKLSLSQRLGKGLNLTTAVDNLFNYIPEYYYSNSPATTGTTFSVGLSIDVEKYFKK